MKTDALSQCLAPVTVLIAALTATTACAPALARDTTASVAVRSAPAPAPAPHPVPAASTATLTLTFDRGARTGRILVALYDSQAAYDGNGQPVRQAMVDAADAEARVVFEALPNGTYAARMFHDVNGNGQMDTNPFGMPTEPFAFSNNAVGNMGPAGWDRASFALTGDLIQTIRIR